MNSFYTQRSSNSSNRIAGYSQRFGLQPADRIKEPIFQTGFSQHHSIYLGMDKFGQEWIAENHWKHGVRMVKANEYFKTFRNYSFIRFEGTYTGRVAAVKRALAELGKPYDLIQYNCEHYATYVQTGKAESKQVWNAAAMLLFALLLGLAFSNPQNS